MYGYDDNPGPKIKCMKCEDVIQSMYRHDFKWCKCKSIAIDGGGDYTKISYDEDVEYELLEENNAKNTES
jgi:hypothetical protein